MRPAIDCAPGLALLVISLALSGCGGGSTAGNSSINAATPGDDGTANGLESLAAESGLISESEAGAPIGSYVRHYGGGEDRLCIRPASGADGNYRFGVEIRIGEEEYCAGSGSVRKAGDTLLFRFAGGRCLVTARHEGDRIVMPGAVDRACARLCSARGSLAGVTFPRIAADEMSASRMTDGSGKPLCGG